MIQLKCKICGGSLELISGQIAQCSSCGNKMLLPAIDSDVRNDMFDRGNYYRMHYEFDRAASAFEQIIARDPEDAEARFCLALCRYGVEYVRDPRTGEYKPTCHRSSAHSILEDVDYQAALRCAPPDYQDFYRQQAAQIHEIWEHIMEIARYEEPYDVFISYKETPGAGINPNQRNAASERTRDSVIAQELYDELTKRGVRVFFSRISLENKLGSAYEPYIFAALQSAKVMLVVGTKREYIDAVWVRNEWKRYLSLRKEDRSREIIPVLQEMDEYDLPDELAEFIPRRIDETGVKQDLLRGILKITGHAEGSVNMIRNRELEKLADSLLEQGNRADALEAAQQMLNLNPENGAAYRIQFMAELGISKLADCKEFQKDFEELPSFTRMEKYAVGGFKKEIDELLVYRRKRRDYLEAVKCLQDGMYEAAYPTFLEAGDYKDAAKLAESCAEKAKKQKEERLLKENISVYKQELEQAKAQVENEWAQRYPEMESRRKMLERARTDCKRPRVWNALLGIVLMAVCLVGIAIHAKSNTPFTILPRLALIICLGYDVYRILDVLMEKSKGVKILLTSFVVTGLSGFMDSILYSLGAPVALLIKDGAEDVSGMGVAVLAAVNLVIALFFFFRNAKKYVAAENTREAYRYFKEVELPELKQQLLDRKIEDLRGKFERLIGPENCVLLAQPYKFREEEKK